MPVTMPAPGASPSYMSHGGERRELEEGRPAVDEALDALARRELSSRAVALGRGLAAALASGLERRVQLVDEPAHRPLVVREPL